jgi:menaquinone-dependent protoporphyrinogen IX oxidase
MKTQILLAYASHFGSTSEIAHEIADVLRQEDLSVDLLDLKSSGERPSLTSYSGVIVGSGIRMASWAKEVLSFIQSNKKQLKLKPLGVFISSGEASNPESYGKAKNKYLYQILDEFQLMGPKIICEAFGGVFDFSSSSNYSFVEKKILQRIADSSSSGFVVNDGKLNDFRNWQLIREWATDFVALINSSQINEKSQTQTVTGV